jgi:hypothetical protein
VIVPFPSSATEEEQDDSEPSPLDEIFALIDFDIATAKTAVLEIDLLDIFFFYFFFISFIDKKPNFYLPLNNLNSPSSRSRAPVSNHKLPVPTLNPPNPVHRDKKYASLKLKLESPDASYTRRD